LLPERGFTDCVGKHPLHGLQIGDLGADIGDMRGDNAPQLGADMIAIGLGQPQQFANLSKCETEPAW